MTGVMKYLINMKLEIENAKETIEKTAKPFGQNGAHVLVPSRWIGKKVQIVLLER